MKLKPDDKWYWFFNEEYNRVMLSISHQTLFCSRFPIKMLISDAYLRVPFSVEDATLLFQFDESVQKLPLSDEQKAQLQLNALVAHRLLKPMMPKSWFFSQQMATITPVLAQIVAAHCFDSDETAILLVVEAGESASLCLLAQPQLVLQDKVYQLGDPIKIMNDRFMPVEFVASQPASAYGAVV